MLFIEACDRDTGNPVIRHRLSPGWMFRHPSGNMLWSKIGDGPKRKPLEDEPGNTNSIGRSVALQMDKESIGDGLEPSPGASRQASRASRLHLAVRRNDDRLPPDLCQVSLAGRCAKRARADPQGRSPDDLDLACR